MGDEIPWDRELAEIRELCEGLRGRMDLLGSELERLIGTVDDVAALLYSRRALEVVASDLCERILNRERGSEPLDSLLSQLQKEKVVPENIAASMRNLNRLSVYGAHPKEFAPRQVREALLSLGTVVEWYFRDRGVLVSTQSAADRPGVEQQAISQRPTSAAADARPAQSDNTLRIVAITCRPGRVLPGEAIHLSFRIDNDASSASELWLGATMVDESGREYWNVGEDVVVRVAPGLADFERRLSVPHNAARGSYRVVGAAWCGPVSRPEQSMKVAAAEVASAFEVVG